ncbi:MAG: hypothetical protein U0W24_08140 [Bacteroidales bacterium]
MELKKNIAISESGFIFDPNTGDSFNLNHVAREIISLMIKGMQDKEITEFVLGKYDVDETIFEQNFFDFKSMLSYYKLINEK